jgi:hypothetical protein
VAERLRVDGVDRRRRGEDRRTRQEGRELTVRAEEIETSGKPGHQPRSSAVRDRTPTLDKIDPFGYVAFVANEAGRLPVELPAIAAAADSEAEKRRATCEVRKPNGRPSLIIPCMFRQQSSTLGVP